MNTTSDLLLRFEISEASSILRLSLPTIYRRIKEGKLAAHKDGRRTFITTAELKRYADACAQCDQAPRRV